MKNKPEKSWVSLQLDYVERNLEEARGLEGKGRWDLLERHLRSMRSELKRALVQVRKTRQESHVRAEETWRAVQLELAHIARDRDCGSEREALIALAFDLEAIKKLFKAMSDQQEKKSGYPRTFNFDSKGEARFIAQALCEAMDGNKRASKG